MVIVVVLEMKMIAMVTRIKLSLTQAENNDEDYRPSQVIIITYNNDYYHFLSFFCDNDDYRPSKVIIITFNNDNYPFL